MKIHIQWYITRPKTFKFTVAKWNISSCSCYVTANHGGQKNRNGKTIAVLFSPCFLLVIGPLSTGLDSYHKQFQNYIETSRGCNLHETRSIFKSGWSKDPQWENDCGSFSPCFLLGIGPLSTGLDSYHKQFQTYILGLVVDAVFMKQDPSHSHTTRLLPRPRHKKASRNSIGRSTAPRSNGKVTNGSSAMESSVISKLISRLVPHEAIVATMAGCSPASFLLQLRPVVTYFLTCTIKIKLSRIDSGHQSCSTSRNLVN